jgi:hypothetical protein
MNIVCSSLVARNFEKVKEFKRDLGFTLSQDVKNGNGPMRTIFKIRDPFVRHYFEIYGFYPNKNGTIGKIGIYIDPKVLNDKLKLFDDDKEFVFEFDSNIENVRAYLSKVIGDIESGTVKAKDIEVNTDGSIEFYVDPNLPPEQYMEEFLKQKKRMEELNLLK